MTRDADTLYANRADLTSARQAADLWRSQLGANPGDFDAAWKLARTEYWIAGHTPEAEARNHSEAGVQAAERAVAIAPDRPDGHFWLAANMGTLAESFGISAGLKYRKPIKSALETVLQLDPGYDEGSAYRALGRWYHKVPALFGGSSRLAEENFRKALSDNPTSTATLFFMAEFYVDAGRKADARGELQKVLDAPLDPGYEPEDRDNKEKAAKLLARIK